MERPLNRRRESIVAAVRVQTHVVRRALRVIAKRQLFIRRKRTARAQAQLTLATALKAALRVHIEDAIGPVAQFGPVAPAVHLQIRDVTRIYLRPKIRRDVRVRNLHAVQEPAHLMPAAHVQQIVGYVSARHIVGDHCERVAAVRARRRFDVALAQQHHRRHRAYIRPIASAVTVTISCTVATG